MQIKTKAKRKFPTVEIRAKKVLGENYISIPSGKELSSSLLLALGLSHESEQFIDWRDNASKYMYLPVISVKIKEKELWPILIVEQVSCLLCCLPHVESVIYKDVFHIPSISVGFSVLTGILNLLGSNTTYADEESERFTELHNYLTISMPFGTPSDTNSSRVVAFCNESEFLPPKQNSLKQMPHKGKSSILIEINEYVRSVQGDHVDFEPAVEVYGNVNVKVESLDHVGEISMILEHFTVGKTLYLDSVIIHPCVQSFTSGGGGASSVPKKFWLVPTSNNFMLCFYSARCFQPTICGLFKMKEDTVVELLVHLKLGDGIKNSFHSCEVYIPFFYRGPVLNFEFKATQGFLHISEDKHSLKWNVGSKFLSKSVDAFLTAKVHLSSGPKNIHNDLFCVGKNSYIQIFFKRVNETLSGCSIDPKSITVSPPQKPKVFIESSVQSTEYKIWNTYGDLPFPVISKDRLPKE